MKLTLTLDLPSALYSHWAPGGIFMNGAGATVFSGAANRTASVFSSCAVVSSEQRSAGGSFARATPLTLNAQARVVMTSRGNRIERLLSGTGYTGRPWRPPGRSHSPGTCTAQTDVKFNVWPFAPGAVAPNRPKLPNVAGGRLKSHDSIVLGVEVRSVTL